MKRSSNENVNDLKGGVMMKSKNKMLIIVLLLLVGVSVKYVAGTYAKYTATVTAEGSATVAKWAFSQDNASTSLAINLTTTADATSLVSGKIAPGTAGNFTLALSNENSDVGVKFDITFTGATNIPSNLVFTYGGNSFNANNGALTGYIAKGETINVPITWSWPYYTSAADDTEDTADGVAANTMTINASIVGVQTDPTQNITTQVSVAP